MAQSQLTDLPDRLDPDAIIEALVEYRFDHSELPEAIVGRLLSEPMWADYAQLRLPAADFPQPLKEIDPTLRYQPIIELRRPDFTRAIKLGGHVFSYHVVGSYPGWTVFQQELQQVTDRLTKQLRSVDFPRLGFRYINLLSVERHSVSGLAETNISISIGDERLINSLNLNYSRSLKSNHTVTVKIATPEMVTTNVQPFSLLCDIDVATKNNTPVVGADATNDWINTAHDIEKQEFFKILRADIAAKLTPDDTETESHA